MADVAIGFIASDHIPSNFVYSVLAIMSQRGEQVKGRVIHTEGYGPRTDIGYHAIANAFVERTEAEYLVLLGSDMVFSVTDYDHLVESVERADDDVISGVYPREDGAPCVFDYDTDEEQFILTDPDKLLVNRWYEAAGVGLGFLAVPRAVLEKVRDEGDGGLCWFELKPDRDEATSFFERVGAAGFTTLVDTDLVVGRVKPVAMYPKLESKLVKPGLEIVR